MDLSCPGCGAGFVTRTIILGKRTSDATKQMWFNCHDHFFYTWFSKDAPVGYSAAYVCPACPTWFRVDSRGLIFVIGENRPGWEFR